MSDELRTWLTATLKQKHWSQHELARQSGVSQARISGVLTGTMKPSPNFCVDVAHALGESPEKLLRLAEILPPLEDDPAIQELIELIKNLSPSQREKMLEYAKFIRQQG